MRARRGRLLDLRTSRRLYAERRSSLPSRDTRHNNNIPRISTFATLFIMAATLLLLVSANPLAARVRHGHLHPDAGPFLENVTYCRTGGVDLKMDVYTARPSFVSPRPALVYVHGGGWTEGDKTWLDRILSSGELALHGYTVVSINYRLSPLHTWPAQIEDAKCAIRSLRANATRFNIDPDRIGVWGESAGGHLAAMLGMAGPDAGFEGTGGYAEQSSRVQAVVDMFGPSDLSAWKLDAPQNSWTGMLLLGRRPDAETVRLGSPITYASADDPPFLIMHGLKDPLVPSSQSQELYSRLIEVGAPAQLVMVQNAGHVFAPSGGPISPGMPELKAMVVAFFDKYLQPGR